MTTAGYWRTFARPDSAATASRAVESTVAVESFEVNAEMLGSSMAKSSSLSVRGLLTYIGYLERNGLDASVYESELWYRGVTNGGSRDHADAGTRVRFRVFAFGSGAGARLMIGRGYRSRLLPDQRNAREIAARCST